MAAETTQPFTFLRAVGSRLLHLLHARPTPDRESCTGINCGLFSLFSILLLLGFQGFFQERHEEPAGSKGGSGQQDRALPTVLPHPKAVSPGQTRHFCSITYLPAASRAESRDGGGRIALPLPKPRQQPPARHPQQSSPQPEHRHEVVDAPETPDAPGHLPHLSPSVHTPTPLPFHAHPQAGTPLLPAASLPISQGMSAGSVPGRAAEPT